MSKTSVDVCSDDRLTNNNIMNTYNRKSIVFKKGKGIWLIDDKENVYMDFVSGVAVNCLGHSHPVFVEKMKNQIENLTHVSNLYWTDEQLELGENLCSLSGLDSAFFCNSGTEAVETAFKLARKHGSIVNKKGKKNKIIVLENAFHGRTMGALSLTWNSKYKVPYEPLVENVVTTPLNDLSKLEAVVDDSVCAIIIEPIQGEGGIYKASKSFLEKASALALKYNALLVFDEVQCGIGRTGNMFAYQHYGIVPDILCLAKGLGAGMPIGAVLTNKRADVFEPGDHGSTFGGNPLASKAGITVLSIVGQNTFLNDVKTTSEYLISGLKKIDVKYNYLTEVRGAGLMLGIETKFKASQLIEKAMKEKLLLIAAGEKTIRLLPPLVITVSEIDLFLSKFEEIIKSLNEE